jgi:MSHA pilin protein MshD
MFPSKPHFYTHGFTLIEIIVTIVVLAIASTSLLSVFTSTVRTSADPMIQQQAISIAEAYMEEIMLKSFSDPRKDDVPPVNETGGSEAGETRVNFNDVQDYNDLLDTKVRDQNNNEISSLEYYTVVVTVAEKALHGIDKKDSLFINITVTHSAISPIAISGYRTNY